MIVSMPFVCSLSSSECHARKIKSTRSVKKTQADALRGETSECDSLISRDSYYHFPDSIASKIRFYGFDKTVSSTLESFFIVNGLEDKISALDIDIMYLDSEGRMLHNRSVTLECDLPAGETRRYDIKSWDTQKSFYFHQSVKPRRQATPFYVKMELKAIRISK